MTPIVAVLDAIRWLSMRVSPWFGGWHGAAAVDASRIAAVLVWGSRTGGDDYKRGARLAAPRVSRAGTRRIARGTRCARPPRASAR
jgi:hypothetical protein